MRFAYLVCAAILSVNPLLADDRHAIENLGLGALQPVGEVVGMRVRGLSANAYSHASSFAFAGFGQTVGGVTSPLTFAGGSGATAFSFQLSGSGAAGGTGVTLNGLFGGSLEFGFTTGGFSIGAP